MTGLESSLPRNIIVTALHESTGRAGARKSEDLFGKQMAEGSAPSGPGNAGVLEFAAQ
jgi:hypothetical protein